MAATTIEQLSVQFDADTRQLEKKLDNVIRANYGAAAKVEKAWASSRVGKALSASLDEVQGRVSDLAGSLPVFGQGLQSMGGFALGAGAALGAVALGLAKVREAVGFAAELQDTADRVGVNVEALQQWRYAAELSGTSAASMDAALTGLQAALGAVRSGLGDEKMLKAFAALGFSETQLRGFTSASDLLPVLADRLQALGQTAESVKIAQALGVDSALPSLMHGAAALQALRTEASATGAVISQALVDRAAAADDRLKSMALRLDGQVKSALLDFVPLLEAAAKVLGGVADMAGRAAGAIGSMDVQLGKLNQSQLDTLKRFVTVGLAAIPGGGVFSAGIGRAVDTLAARGREKGFAVDDYGAHLPASNQSLYGTGRPRAASAKGGGAVKAPRPVNELSGITIALSAETAQLMGLENDLALARAKDDGVRARALEAQIKQLTIIQDLKAKGVPEDLATLAAIEATATMMGQVTGEVETQVEALSLLSSEWKTFADQYGGQIADMVAQWATGMGDIDDLWRQLLLKMAQDFISSEVLRLINNLGQSNGGGGTASVLASVVNLFSGGKGGRAGGGAIGPGVYPVGEQGPELLLSRGPGEIVSRAGLKSMLGGGGDTIVVNAQAGVTREDLASAMSIAFRAARRQTPIDMARVQNRRLGL